MATTAASTLTSTSSAPGAAPQVVGIPVLSGRFARLDFNCLDRIWSFFDPVKELPLTASICRYTAARIRAMSLSWAAMARFVGCHFAPAIPDTAIKQTVLPIIGQANAQFRATFPLAEHPDTAFKGHQIQQLRQWIQKVHSGKYFKSVAEIAITTYRVDLLAVLLAQVEGPDGVNFCANGYQGNHPPLAVKSLLEYHIQIIEQTTHPLQVATVNAVTLTLYRTMSRLDPIQLFRTVHHWVWEKMERQGQHALENPFTNGSAQLQLVKTMGLNIRIQARIFKSPALSFHTPEAHLQAIESYAELGFRPASKQFPPTLSDKVVNAMEEQG